jgi:uncharacterized membrane protein (DUF485 family)
MPMGGLDFKEPVEQEDESEKTVAYNTRTALYLFAVYVVFYVCFMLLSAFRPEFMAQPVLAGVNLAVVFGFVLILLALALALLYMALSRTDSKGGAE